MFRLSLIIALTASVALPAFAQTVLREAGGDDGPPPNVFLDPAGRPWRAAEDAPYPVAAWFAQVDTDGNGSVNFTEFDADATRFFDILDTDKDGKLSNLEVVAYETEVAPEILTRGPTAPRMRAPDRRSVGSVMSPRGVKKLPPGLLRKGAGRFSLLDEPQPVAAADIDFNAIITREEWSQAARRRFNRLDANTDRKIVREELPATPAQVQRGS